MAEGHFDELRHHLLRGSQADEEAAFLLGGISNAIRSTVLVREIVSVPDSAMLAKGPAGITIAPEFIAPLAKRCRNEKLSLLQTHSHPFSRRMTTFSSIDDRGEASLFPRIRARAPSSVLGAIVFGQDSFDARIWPLDRSGSIPATDLVTVGDSWMPRFPSYKEDESRQAAETYSRQTAVVGSHAQEVLGSIAIAIVGLGGIGSQVAQQLTHLGIRHLTLIDDDTIEESNRSRVVGTRAGDVGRPKVEVIAELLRSIHPTTQVRVIKGNVHHNSVALHLRDCDVIFGCTDTLVSRMVLTRFASQYLVPLIDMGINIQMNGATVARIGGRVMVQRPGDPCLDCMGILQAAELSRELLSPAERAANPYVQNAQHEFAPAVISLNGVVSSLAVTELLHLVSGKFGTRIPRTYQIYDGLKGVVRAVAMKPDKTCGVCEEVRGMGDLVPLPCIQDR